MSSNIQTITLAGQRFVILPEADYREIVGETWEPALPKQDTNGNFPAIDAARVLLARKIMRRRRAAGLTQEELAKRAGLRVETLCRLEHAKHSATAPTVDKLVRVLDQVERVAATHKNAAPEKGHKTPRRK